MSEQNKEVPADKAPDYDAPKIEEVVTPSDLEREAQYAGLGSQRPPG